MLKWLCWDDKMAVRQHCYLENRISEVEVMYVDFRDFLHGKLEYVIDADASYAVDIRTQKSTVGYNMLLQGPYGTRIRLRIRCTL